MTLPSIGRKLTSDRQTGLSLGSLPQPDPSVHVPPAGGDLRFLAP